MKVLWQWHRITAVDDTEIIAKANRLLQYEFESAQAIVARGLQTVSSVEDAAETMSNYERGVVDELGDSDHDVRGYMVYLMEKLGIPANEAERTLYRIIPDNPPED